MVVKGRTILVIDPDQETVEALRPLMKERACTVVQAATREEGFRCIEHDRPDVILLEAMLPDGIEGFHLVWQLRCHPNTSICNIPIVVATWLHRTTELRLYPHLSDCEYGPGEFLPVQDFIDKPVTSQALANCLCRFLPDEGEDQ
jgi:CheY-like chemotaxis protein